MNRTLGLLIALVIIAAGGIGAAKIAGNHNKDNTNTNTSTPAPTPTPTTPTPPPTSSNQNATQADKVTIQNLSFTPSSITVKKGTTVTWTNNDSTAHTVTSDSGNELASSNISPGSNFTHTFNATGTFNYHCSIHRSMSGMVIVTD